MDDPHLAPPGRDPPAAGRLSLDALAQRQSDLSSEVVLRGEALDDDVLLTYSLTHRCDAG